MASVQGHPCRYRRGLTPTQVSTALNQQDTTAQVEGTASRGRGRDAATQRRSAHDGRMYPPYIGSEDAGDDVERKLRWH
jgi:hypothetical protein